MGEMPVPGRLAVILSALNRSPVLIGWVATSDLRALLSLRSNPRYPQRQHERGTLFPERYMSSGRRTDCHSRRRSGPER
jgi:hypothetical protein